MKLEKEELINMIINEQAKLTSYRKSTERVIGDLKKDKIKLQNNWNTLKQKLEKTIKSIEKESLINFKKEKKCYQTVLNEMLEMQKENE